MPLIKQAILFMRKGWQHEMRYNEMYQIILSFIVHFDVGYIQGS